MRCIGILLYGVGPILGVYAAAVAVGGDGFLAAFAAGMAMLLPFILFGALLSTLLDEEAVVVPAIMRSLSPPLAM